MTELSYELELVEEEAVAHVQAMILRLLDEKKISRTELAKMLGVSGAHVSQLLGDEPQNLSVRKAARVFHHLGEELIITCKGIEEMNKRAELLHARKADAIARSGSFQWRRYVNNNDEDCERVREPVAA